MNCVKCGREIEQNQAFCPVCLEEMEQYPVKPGTVVHIPKRPEDEADKKSTPVKKATPSAEQQIRKLKRKVRWLRIWLALLMLICGILAYGIGRAVEELDVHYFIGQNYSTIETIPSVPHVTAPTN